MSNDDTLQLAPRTFPALRKELLKKPKPVWPHKLTPPWEEYPDISPKSEGWRTGPGEEYFFEFVDWFFSLEDDQRAHYQQTFREPLGWEGFLEKGHFP